jgi:hypothetical protein
MAQIIRLFGVVIATLLLLAVGALAFMAITAATSPSIVP